MLINLVEHRAREALLALIEDINRVQTSVWGLAFIKRRTLKIMNNDGLMMALKPAFADIAEAKLFVLENGDVYVAWRGMQKRVHEQLCEIAGRLLLRESQTTESQVVYFDPLVMGNEITTLLRAQEKERAPPVMSASAAPPTLPKNMPKPEARQMRQFHNAAAHRAERKQLELLIVEDQQLLRRLLHEVLRGEHHVDSVGSLHEGWSAYLEKAPDIAFLDIGLGDGNGHDLARAIKQIDPNACVIMVTANNTLDEIEIARLNHADGFVAKPYSKQQIFDYIDRHVGSRRLSAVQGKYQ
jgi:two-component system chemotaxis response regulator CheY